jgi:hypothetical protein
MIVAKSRKTVLKLLRLTTMLRRGLTVEKVAAKIKMDEHSLWDWARRHGVDLRPAYDASAGEGVARLKAALDGTPDEFYTAVTAALTRLRLPDPGVKLRLGLLAETLNYLEMVGGVSRARLVEEIVAASSATTRPPGAVEPDKHRQDKAAG